MVVVGCQIKARIHKRVQNKDKRTKRELTGTKNASQLGISLISRKFH